MTTKEFKKISRRPWDFGGRLLEEVIRLRIVQREHKAALRRLLDVSRCQNGCKPGDMRCATRAAQLALKSS